MFIIKFSCHIIYTKNNQLKAAYLVQKLILLKLSKSVFYLQRRWAFQNPDGSEHPEVVTLCCAIKPLASWNLENVVSITRERCGGQGYLSCNRYIKY